MSLGLALSAILAVSSGGLFIARKFFGVGTTKKARTLDEIVKMHAEGNFSDELDYEPDKEDDQNETKNKTPDLHPVYHTILLTTATICGFSAYNDRLPYSLREFNSFADNQEVLSTGECWDLMRSLDSDKNKFLSIKEFSKSKRYYHDLSWWGINGFRSKLNLKSVQDDLLYETEGKLPEKTIW